MNLSGAKWVGSNTGRDRLFFRAPPSGGFNRTWPWNVFIEIAYWRDFKRKHVCWRGIRSW